MGQEILYCSKCQTQLRSVDFDKEKAYRLHNSVYCYRCARESVHSLPPETIQKLIGQIAKEEAAEKKNSSTSRILRVAEIRPLKSGSTRRPTEPGATALGPAAWITLGVLGAGALLVGLLFSGTSESKSLPRIPPPPPLVQAPPPAPRPAMDSPGPRPPPPPPPPPTGSAGTFDAEATESLNRAREFARTNPQDLVGQIALFEKAAWESSGTPLQDAAQRDLETLKAKDRAPALKELPGLLDSVRTAAGKEEFGQALTLLERGRKLHAVSEWTGPVEKTLKDLREQMASLYGPLKEKALAAARSRNSAELEGIRERIAKWNLEEFRSDLEHELGRSAPLPSPPTSPVEPKTPPSGEPLRVQPLGEADPDPGLVGLWRFDEGKGVLTADSSRNRNTATLVNGAAWTGGKWAGGLAFNGTDSEVLVPATTSLADLGPLSVSAWVKPRKLKLGRVVAKENGGRGRWMLIAGESGIAFSKDFSVQELRRETIVNLLPLEQWTHLAVTWDGTAQVAQIHIYVNGIEAAYAKNQDGTGKKMSDAPIPLSLGNRGDLTRGFEGSIDEVRIYSRVLTGKEITALASPKEK